MKSRPLLILSAFVCYWAVVTCGSLDEQLCADHLHQECKCDFAHALSSDDQWCHKLQSCGNCMAVPRCNSRYLNKYRDLLLVTLTMAKSVSICPGLEYESLEKNIQASKKACVEGTQYTNRCDMRCRCKEGRYQCYRIRKEFTHMSFAERRRFVRAYYQATTDPVYKDAFVGLLNKHSRMPNKYLHHLPQIFLPWHRWFLTQIENLLRQIDCRITIPYYQWTSQDNPFNTAVPESVWASGPQGLGGNGVPPDWCVHTGLFREGHWSMPISKGGGCIKRQFNFSCPLYDDQYLQEMLQENFTVFEYRIREKLHNDFHDCTGMLMHHHETSGNTPEFSLHHAFMDKIWQEFQSRSDENMFAYYTTLNILMPQADRYPWEFLENDRLPGDIGVEYEQF